MTYPISILNYHQHDLEAVEIDGQKWLRVAHLVPPLGLGSRRAVMTIYERNRDEFTADETRLLELPTEGGPQEVLMFSLRGARLLALLARTPEAKAFRRWVLDLLEGRTRSGPRHPIAPLATETHLMLEDIERLAQPGTEIALAIADYREGRRGLPQVGPLATLRHERRAIVAAMASAQSKLRDLYQRARRLGYRPETLKWEPPAQAALGFDGLGDATE